MHPGQQGVGEDADHEYQHDQRDKRCRFPGIEVQQLGAMGRRWASENHALHEPENIGGCQDDSQGGQGRGDLAPEEGAGQHQEFADETVGAGQA